MLKNVFQSYVDAVSDNGEIGVAVYSIVDDDEIAVTYDITVDINIHGDLLISIAL